MTRPVHIGCSGWDSRAGRTSFYPPRPPGAAVARALRHAVRHRRGQRDLLPARVGPRRSTGWVHHTPPEFVFAVKSSRYLTHMKRLGDMDRGVGRFYDSIAPLAESPKLGPVLWQLPDRLRARRRAAGARAVEPAAGAPRVRAAPPRVGSPSPGVGGCCASTAPRSCSMTTSAGAETPEVLTADFTYLRFHYGRRGRRGNYSDAELRDWASQRARARARGGGLRLLQQRLGGLRPAATPRGRLRALVNSTGSPRGGAAR